MYKQAQKVNEQQSNEKFYEFLEFNSILSVLYVIVFIWGMLGALGGARRNIVGAPILSPCSASGR